MNCFHMSFSNTWSMHVWTRGSKPVIVHLFRGGLRLNLLRLSLIQCRYREIQHLGTVCQLCMEGWKLYEKFPAWEELKRRDICASRRPHKLWRKVLGPWQPQSQVDLKSSWYPLTDARSIKLTVNSWVTGASIVGRHPTTSSIAGSWLWNMMLKTFQLGICWLSPLTSLAISQSRSFLLEICSWPP